jgi:hypothetical protein
MIGTSGMGTHRIPTNLRRGRSRLDADARSCDRRSLSPLTVQTDHKALNLARDLPVLSYCCRIANSIPDHGRSGLHGRRLSCDATRGFGDEQQDEEEAESVEKADHVGQRRGPEHPPDLAELGCIREPGLSQ